MQAVFPDDETGEERIRREASVIPAEKEKNPNEAYALFFLSKND